MDQIHLNKKSACFNIILNLCLLSLMVYVVKTSDKPHSIPNNEIIKPTTNKDSLQYFPKGDWFIDTLSYEIINGHILCGVIKNNAHLLNNNKNIYDDCIVFKNGDYIIIENNRYKVMHL